MEDFKNIFDNSFWSAMLIGFLLPTVILCCNKDISECEKRAYSRYIASSFIIEKIIFIIYYQVILNIGIDYLVQSGIVLTILLIFSGKLIEKVYNILKIKNRKRMYEIFDIKSADKVFILGVVTLGLALDYIFISKQISLFCISLVLGKYFWIDSGFLSLHENIKKIKKDWDNISNVVKQFSFVFIFIIFVSDYGGAKLANIINVKSYIISMYISVDLCIIYYFYQKTRK